MALPLPSSLSPSKLSTFRSCGLHFRFTSVEGLPEAPTLATSRGTLVHAALEQLFKLPASERLPEIGSDCVDSAFAQYRDHPEWTGLELDEEAEQRVLSEAKALVDNYFELEDPRDVSPIGIELKVEAKVEGLLLRGIIDRLDLVDGELVVTDYKTGSAPGDSHARTRMTGVHLYSLMCEKFFGRRPVRVQLLHLAEPVAIVAEPTEQSTRGLERRVTAVWAAIEQACESGNFAPRRSALCDWCSFQAYCPAFGGDPDLAAVELSREIDDKESAGQMTLVPT